MLHSHILLPQLFADQILLKHSLVILHAGHQLRTASFAKLEQTLVLTPFSLEAPGGSHVSSIPAKIINSAVLCWIPNGHTTCQGLTEGSIGEEPETKS